jgi:hypothetical protein
MYSQQFYANKSAGLELGVGHIESTATQLVTSTIAAINETGRRWNSREISSPSKNLQAASSYILHFIQATLKKANLASCTPPTLGFF